MIFAELPACSCEGCKDLPQVARIFPLRPCYRCGEICGNPDCEKPNGGKPVRVKTTVLSFDGTVFAHAPA